MLNMTNPKTFPIDLHLYYKRFGGIFRLWFGPQLFVVISDPGKKSSYFSRSNTFTPSSEIVKRAIVTKWKIYAGRNLTKTLRACYSMPPGPINDNGISEVFDRCSLELTIKRTRCWNCCWQSQRAEIDNAAPRIARKEISGEEHGKDTKRSGDCKIKITRVLTEWHCNRFKRILFWPECQCLGQFIHFHEVNTSIYVQNQTSIPLSDWIQKVSTVWTMFCRN